jgi:hypothetical protein
MAGLKAVPGMPLVHDLWHGRVPFQRLLWRHLAVYGSLINLVFGLATLALLALDFDAVWAVIVHFVPLPWNGLLLAAVWRHPRCTVFWKVAALAWFLAMLVI